MLRNANGHNKLSQHERSNRGFAPRGRQMPRANGNVFGGLSSAGSTSKKDPCDKCGSTAHIWFGCKLPDKFCMRCGKKPCNNQDGCKPPSAIRPCHIRKYAQAQNLALEGNDGPLNGILNDVGKLFEDIAFDTRARVPVDHESNDVVRKDPFGVYTALGMVALSEQVLPPRLQHIENAFMSSREIGFGTTYAAADDNPNQYSYSTDIFVSKHDKSDAAAFLRRQQRGRFVKVRYCSLDGQWRTKDIIVDAVHDDEERGLLVVTVKDFNDFMTGSDVQFAESTGVSQLKGTLRRLRRMLDRILNPGTGLQVTLMTKWYEMHLRDLTATRGEREANEDRAAVKPEQIRDFIKSLHDSDSLPDGLKESLDKLTNEQVMAIRRMVVENHFVLDGAFGTGKTLLIALAAIFVAYELDKKVLLLAKTNEAADQLAVKVYELAEPFLEKGLQKLGLELWAQSGEKGIPIIRHYANNVKKHWLTSEDGTKIVHCGMYSHAKNDLVMDVLVVVSNKKIVITTAEHATTHQHFVNKEAARVLAETQLDKDLAARRTPFEADVIIVDEAGLLHYIHMLLVMLCVARQVTLDEDCEHKPTKVSIVGDIRQLIPNLSVHWPLHEEELNKRGFNLSPLHVWIAIRVVYLQLPDSFRCPVDCVQPINELFYDGKLKLVKPVDSANDLNKLRFFGEASNVQKPINCAYVVVKGSDERKLDGGSYENEKHVKCSLELIEQMVQTGYVPKRESITYMCFYNGQKALMLKELSKKPRLRGVVVPVTADQYQGKESDYVIVDFPRTADVGFLRTVQWGHVHQVDIHGNDIKDAKGKRTVTSAINFNGRFVVGMTRARKAMIVVSNVYAMKNPADLQAYYEKMRENDVVYLYDPAKPQKMTKMTEDIHRVMLAEGQQRLSRSADKRGGY